MLVPSGGGKNIIKGEPKTFTDKTPETLVKQENTISGN